MERTTPIALEVAMMTHDEIVRNAERRRWIREVSDHNQVSRIAGLRRTVGNGLIMLGERVHIDECRRADEEVASEPLSLTMAR